MSKPTKIYSTHFNNIKGLAGAGLKGVRNSIIIN